MKRAGGMAVILALLAAAVMAQTRPAGQNGADAKPSVGPMRVEHLMGFNYLYVSREATLKTIGQVFAVELPKLIAALKTENIQMRGGMISVYHGLTADPSRKFNVDIGFPVEAGAMAPEGYQLLPLSDTNCATVVYSGRMAEIGQAYQQLYPKLFARGLQPTGDTREYYLYWEDANSPNNVVLVAVVLK